MKSILVVDDEQSIRFSLQAIFSKDYVVITAENGQEALRLAEEESPDIAIIDMMMAGMSGLELLPKLKELDPNLTVLVLSGVHEIPDVVKAVQLGAAQYLPKPFNVQEIRLAVEMALRETGRANEISALESEMSRWYDPNGVVGRSPQWRETLSLLERAAKAADTTVMLYGESGTGKELLARLTHNLSSRRAAPLIPIHCAAIPETLLESELFGHEKGSFTGASQRRRGCVEMADGGTLFLDEIGEMPVSMQSKLLRFLQDHSFMRVGGRTYCHANVRVVGATNRDLRQGVQEGWFREDLFYRLNVVPIMIPPLRERSGDVPLLVECFLDHFRRECGGQMRDVSAEAMALLNAHAWPGNVRELRNLMERIVVLHGREAVLLPEHLPPEIRQGGARAGHEPVPATFPLSMEAAVCNLETRLIRQAMAEADGNLSKVAELLQTTRRIVKYKADSYGLT